VRKDGDLSKDLVLNEVTRNQFLEQIDKDVSFLRKQSIMDYSLLLGVHNVRQEVERLIVHDPVLPFFQSSEGGIQAPVSMHLCSHTPCKAHPR
jgi:hypothetical protein